MQKAPDWKGSGLKPVIDVNKSKDDALVHVFGKNLEERVITNEDEVNNASSLFAPDPTKENDQNNPEDDNSDSGNIEALKKRKFDAITGEEDEDTVFQGDFKLFVWDFETSNWIEKGRGQLKLNDSIEFRKKQSRLIMRICGTLRIVLNISINSSHFKVIAATKTNIRFSDSQNLWAASGNNAHQLRDLIEDRLKESADSNLESKKKPKAPENDKPSVEDVKSNTISNESPNTSADQEFRRNLNQDPFDRCKVDQTRTCDKPETQEHRDESSENSLNEGSNQNDANYKDHDTSEESKSSGDEHAKKDNQKSKQHDDDSKSTESSENDS